MEDFFIANGKNPTVTLTMARSQRHWVTGAKMSGRLYAQTLGDCIWVKRLTIKIEMNTYYRLSRQRFVSLLGYFLNIYT